MRGAKLAVASLRRDGVVLLAIEVEQGLAQPGARRDDRDVAPGASLARLQHLEIGRRKKQHAEGGRFQIIEQTHAG